MHPYLNCGVISLPVYNLLVGLSIYVGLKVFEHNESKYNTSDRFIKNNKELIFIGCIVGGFCTAAIFENFYHSDFSRMGKYGITFYGGLLFGIFALFATVQFSLSRAIFLINLCVPALLAAHAIGRIACLMGGCCYGALTHSILGICYPNGERRIPIQLIESGFLLLGFVLTVTKIKFPSRYLFYFIYYPIIRFVLEYFRNDNRGQLFDGRFSPSQSISLVLLLFVSGLFVLQHFYLSNRLPSD